MSFVIMFKKLSKINKSMSFYEKSMRQVKTKKCKTTKWFIISWTLPLLIYYCLDNKVSIENKSKVMIIYIYIFCRHHKDKNNLFSKIQNEVLEQNKMAKLTAVCKKKNQSSLAVDLKNAFA